MERGSNTPNDDSTFNLIWNHKVLKTGTLGAINGGSQATIAWGASAHTVKVALLLAYFYYNVDNLFPLLFIEVVKTSFESDGTTIAANLATTAKIVYTITS